MAISNNTELTNIAQQIARVWNLNDEEQIDLLSHNIEIQVFKKDELIYKDFEKPKRMMCLIDGKVKIYKDGIGRNQIVRVIKPIEFFGYRAYFANENYKTSAMAFESSVIAFIPIDVITHLINTYPSIGLFFIRHLSRELGASDDRIVHLTQKHIRGRLAEAILFLKDCYGFEADGHTLNIYLSREDMANMSNMTTSNAIRTLSAFANEKLIAIDGKKIKILNSKELLRISQLG